MKTPINKTDYKWIDVERENKTTDNPVYWIEGIFILLVIALFYTALIIYSNN